jgi:hypothetical protein
MANERDAFLREIEEEVRRERLAKLWDKYGVAVLGGMAAIVLLVGGWKWYQAHQISVAAQAGAQFAEVSALLEDGKKEDAVRGFEQIAKEGTYGYGQLARLRLAAQARKDGKTDVALRYYEELAADSGADELLRGFAQLQIATLKVDTASWTETKNRLTDLVKEDNPWRFAARELHGVAAYKAGKFDEARKAFTELLASGDTPNAIRQRAQMVMALVTRQTTVGTDATAPAKKQDVKNEAEKSGDAKTQ